MNWNKVINRIKAFLNKSKQNKPYAHSTHESENPDPWLGSEIMPQDNFIDSPLQYDDVHTQHNIPHQDHHNNHHLDHIHHHTNFSDHTSNHDATFSSEGHLDHGSFDSGSASMSDNN